MTADGATIQDRGTARLLQLKAGQPGPAVVIVPGFGGSAQRLTGLGGLLATTMPVFAIEGRGIDGAAPPDTDVCAMALHYVDRIRTLQVGAPYFLIGHSFGGLVALEMARALMRAGDNIACLILLDSNFAGQFWPWRYYLQVLAGRFLRRLREFRAIPAGYKAVFLKDMLDLFRRKFGALDVTQAAEDDAMAAHQAAFARYDPGFYPGQLVFFRASLRDYPADPEPLWGSRVRELDIHTATGGHLSMLDPPHAASLAAGISACLARACAATEQNHLV